ncbi:MAG: MFS transporter [Phycisphaerae bacterium]|nr:MFS transporter [Phycisphaerae bacterium]
MSPVELTDAPADPVASDSAATRSPVPQRTPARSAVGPFWTLQVSHTVIDIFPVFIASLAVTLNDTLKLTPAQYAAMFAIGPIVSGLPQAFFAWATDKYDTRFCAWFGLALGSACLCSIGFAETFWQLILLQIVGMTGTGMYHPIGAALAGQLAQRALRHGRSWGVSIFYSAGMIGGITGPIICTRMTAEWGMRSLAWLILPSVMFAWILMRVTSTAPHRQDGHHAIHRALPDDERRARWRAIWILFTANIMRFVVNTGIMVLFGYWARARFPGDGNVTSATNLTGNLVSALSVGMMIFGLLGGRLIRPGRERGPMIWLSLIGAVPVGLIAFLGDRFGPWAGYAAAAASAVGFAATIPCTISLAQRLLPARTGLASGLMLGTSWSVACVAPWYAKFLLGGVGPDQVNTLPPWRIDAAFAGFAVLLLIAAALTLLLPKPLLRHVAQQG